MISVFAGERPQHVLIVGLLVRVVTECNQSPHEEYPGLFDTGDCAYTATAGGSAKTAFTAWVANQVYRSRKVQR